MREYIVESIINNLEHINLHFLKCVLAYTNVLARNKRGKIGNGRKQRKAPRDD